MFIYLVWQTFTYEVAQNSIVGSLIYLPHGVRVICFCYFSYRSIPALFLAEGSHHYLKQYTDCLKLERDEESYMWALSSAASLFAVVAAVEIVKWSRINANYNILKPLNFSNYRFLFLVILISAAFNAIFTNATISILNPEMDMPINRVFTYLIGDTFGSIVVVMSLMAIFSTLRDSKLILTKDRK